MSNENSYRIYPTTYLREIERSIPKLSQAEYIKSLVDKGLPENLAIKAYESYFGGAS